MSGIYAIVNKVNNKIYIGQTVNFVDRLSHHKSSLRHNRHDSSYLQRAWNKYGEENFEFKILEECDESKQDERERYYISLYHSTDREYGYNRETGGSLNKHLSEDLRKEMSEKMKGKYAGEKNPMYGKHIPCSEETKKKLSAMFSGPGNPMYGIRLEVSDEQRRKISERTMGELNPFYGKKHTEEARKKMSDSKKKTPVICVETGVHYESAKEAMRQTGIHNGSILRSCKHTNIMAGGYHWNYYIA